MNNTMIDTKAVITALKKVKEDRNLSIDKIYNIVAENDPASEVSRTTVARVFREGSEEQIFKWENTLRPIANALLDLEDLEPSDNNDTRAMKSILRLKKDIIDELEQKIKTVESEEKRKYHEKLEKEMAKYQRSLDFAMKQIELKDNRIDQLMNDNHLLLNQMLSCHKKCSGGRD